MNIAVNQKALLEVNRLRIEISGGDVNRVCPVRDVSFRVRNGEVLALAGESGSGKSLTALALARLLPPELKLSSGSIYCRDENIMTMPEKRLRRFRGGTIAYVFQEPAESMNPVRRIGGQIAEAFRLHHVKAQPDALRTAFSRVGLDPVVAGRYPHQMSGGMLQRAMIAMALACNPALLVADEPTTALDVTVQQQILHLLHQIRNDTGMAILLITHNLGVVAETADTLVMMYSGLVVESGPAVTVLSSPRHPYTQALLAAVPRLDQDRCRPPKSHVNTERLDSSAATGCPFNPRCKYAKQRCRCYIPDLVTVNQEHEVRCHYWKSVT